MNKPLSEYPRPQFHRDSYLSLNGEWDYKISTNPEIPSSFDGKILVPFSPESPLSGVNHVLQPNEFLFYHLKLDLPNEFLQDIVILHFTAVDQIADIYLNDEFIYHHEGGFLPFLLDIKPYLKDENHLIVKVVDYTDTSYLSRGKQKLKHGGIWYTPQSGIYMPVWLESYHYHHIESIKFAPDIDNEEIVINVSANVDSAIIHIFGNDRPIDCNKDVHIKVKNMKLWSPNDPYLYMVRVEIPDEDEITSYFAMRKFSIVTDKDGYKRFALNNEPIFMKGVLDQGYYKDSFLTPPSYQSYINDIELVKSLGFNTIRKHIKIEMPRWYFECDKRGVIVWQDFVNGGSNYKLGTVTFPLITGIHHDDHNYRKFSRLDKRGRELAREEFKETIRYLYNSPCIALYTIFNEGWGQFGAKEILPELQQLDNTRLYDHASGWHDQGIGDIKSLHVYFKKVKLPSKKDRAIILSEFGGLVLPIEGHKMDGNHVYKSYKNPTKWLEAYQKMIKRDVVANISKGLAASIYTQLSDVEEETNGFITYDREIIKVDSNKIREINNQIELDITNYKN